MVAASERPNAISRWLGLAGTAIVALITIVVVSLAAVSAAGLFGYRTITVQNTALQPDVPHWAVLVEKAVLPDELRAGDIITFTGDTNPGVVFTQRVVATDPKANGVSLLTKPLGQESDQRQWQVNPQQSVGRVVFQAPLVGYVLQLIDQPGAIVGLVVLGLAVLGLRSRFRGSKAASAA